VLCIVFQSSVSPFVPAVVELCVNVVESKGLDMFHIYRIPGTRHFVSELVENVNGGLDKINLEVFIL
jgi:hypothetical protein